MINSTDFSKLKPNQNLYLINYSSKQHPYYKIVHFKYYDNQTKNIEICWVNTNGKKQNKKIGYNKAVYRLFICDLEMAFYLYDCFNKRHIKLIDEYISLIERSQTIKPEVWI